jgi:hypothetical protein
MTRIKSQPLEAREIIKEGSQNSRPIETIFKKIVII